MASSTRIVVLAVLSAALVACGDASTTSANHFTGVGGGNAGNGGGGGSGGGGSDAGGGGSADGGSSQTQGFEVMTDKTSYDVELRASAPVQVTIAPQSFSGTVNLAVTGLPSGVTGTFASSSVAVSGNTGATTTLTLTTISSIVPGAVPFTVTATSGSTSAQAAVSLNVLPQITIQIPMNVDAQKGTSGNPSTTAYGDYPIVMTAPANFGTGNPIVVKFENLDSAPHCIHASNASQGFPHDAVTNGVCDTPMQTNQFDQTAHNVNTKGSYLFYLHDQGNLTDGMITIQ
jgi:hypothetical protein